MSIAQGLKEVLQNRDAVTMRGEFGIELFAKRTKNNELALSMKGANGWELVALIGGAVEYSRVLFSCVAETVAAMLKSEAQNAAQAPQSCEAVNVSAASQNVAQGAVAAPHSPRVKSFRRVFAVAREAGLDIRADAPMRDAFSRFLGRHVESRAALQPADLLLISNAIKTHQLSW